MAAPEERKPRRRMPTLVRLLSALVLVVGAIVAAMVALVTFVEPRQGPITVEVPVPALETPSAPPSVPVVPSAAAAPAAAGETAPTTTGGVAP